MAEKISNENLNEEHIRLASIIKGVHKHLRREYRANGKTHEQVWQRHKQDSQNLRLYADAMYQLATEHWSVYPETRVHWCRKVIVEYFHKNGLRVALEKDAKRQMPSLLRIEKNESTDMKHFLTNISGGHDTSNLVMSDTPLKEAEIVVPQVNKIRLLDVGSCYNPFLLFDEFDVLAIDLSPAKQTVLQCDFLELNTPALPPPLDPLDFNLKDLSNPLHQLPCCSFHVVVFSLLLEYLPSAVQRWQCCLKAYSLLAVNGLLLIITPDSHSQHRNSSLIKSWKQAIESLGFQRWKYEKMDHIHCMAFRKLAQTPKTPEASSQVCTFATRVEEMLYIPQDFNDACYDDVKTTQTCSTESLEELEEFIKRTMEELPMLGLEDS